MCKSIKLSPKPLQLAYFQCVLGGDRLSFTTIATLPTPSSTLPHPSGDIHCRDGKFEKNYDRKLTASSLTNFLRVSHPLPPLSSFLPVTKPVL